jgi:adenine-specific DNA-methyltransferase
MFREPKPGYSEIMELLARLNADFPGIADVEAALRELFNKHKQE